jgi:hypothetical protein
MAKVSTKEVLQSDGWIITKVMQGYNGKVRIDAKRRFHKDDSQNLFCEWVTLKYANRCRREIDKKDLEITHY